MRLKQARQLNSEQISLSKQLAEEFNISPKVMNLIVARNITTKQDLQDYLFASEKDFSNPMEMIGMKEAVGRLEKAVKNAERIFIVSDYDCDGLSGLGIFMRYFDGKACEVQSYIPEREEGYGLNFDAIKPHLEAFKPHLLMTCDLGITAVEETQQIKAMGIDVIITDHHLPKETLPDCTIINPKLQPEKTQYCGAGVVFKLMQGMGEDYKKYIELAATATVGDGVPLTMENRLIVKAGLSKMNQDPEHLFREFADSLKISKFDSSNLAYTIVPRLNAGGRMGKANLCKELVSKKEHEYSRIKDLVLEVSSLNEKRQSVTAENLKLAKKLAQEQCENKILVIYSESFFVGILGILASKIAEEFARPCIVLSIVGTEAKGSARSVGEINLHDCIEKCTSHLLKFGGHKMACGLSLEISKIEDFRSAIQKVADTLPNSDFEETRVYDEKIEISDISLDFIYDLEAMEPFGEGNVAPMFYLNAENGKYRTIGKTGEHISGVCGGVKIVGFSASKYLTQLNAQKSSSMLCSLAMDRYQGRETPSAYLKWLEPREEHFYCEDVMFFEKIEGEMATFEDVEKSISNSPFSTLLIVPSKCMLDKLSNWAGMAGFALAKNVLNHKNGINTILCNPESSDGMEIYKNIYSFGGIIPKECDTEIIKKIKVIKSELATSECKEVVSREVFTMHYKMLKSLEGERYNREVDIAYDLKAKYSVEIDKQVLFFTIDVLRELGILEVKSGVLLFTDKKSPLASSEIYQNNQKGGETQ